jgi:superfamily II DNA or RNA helicase
LKGGKTKKGGRTLTKKGSKGPRQHAFRDKLLLNQWLISLFGINPLAENKLQGKKIRPFYMLADSLKDSQLEGLDHDNLHYYYHALVNSSLFWNEQCILSKEQILVYETNIVKHTLKINEKRHRPVVWKYYQWLTLLFVEIYLDRYFGDRDKLLSDLNDYVGKFNRKWVDFSDVPPYLEDDLNKLCLQSATGSGKTLLMHVNLLQYRYYARKHGKDKDLSRVILLTPNERLSDQHISEFRESSISAGSHAKGSLFGLNHVDVMEITKLADLEGPSTVETRSLGDHNLLLVDEGHRGMSGKEEGAWLTRRSQLCFRGFSFEYSATFEQAVSAAGRSDFENSYAKAIIFDYSYRWFYEEGFGKDYQILNLPESFQETKLLYLTACLLKFYQQLRIYEEKYSSFVHFNLEKPLWVFVGSTVSSAKGSKDEKIVATDVAQIIQFVADFLANPPAASRRIYDILTGKGQDTGLIDKNGIDIFAGAFSYLAGLLNNGETVDAMYRDINSRIFNNPAGGILVLERIKGESGEIALRVGTGEILFGLINVGDAKGLCDHIAEVAVQNKTNLLVQDSEFIDAMFSTVKDSSSPVNLLIGSKKFVEGWDCWRVSTMGLMHVGRSEGAQIIQLFGRGVRLKGYEWSLKRSGHSRAILRPNYIEEIETLNVFGIQADFMEKFRDFLKSEGLPGNERKKTFTVRLNVTYDFGRKLKILRPRKKASDGREYDFKQDGPVPTVGDVPEYLRNNTVVSDWYPRIQAVQSRGVALATQKYKAILSEQHLAFLDYDALYFELEQFKRERNWHNLNITKEGIHNLLKDSTWYTLYLPEAWLTPSCYDDIMLLQRVATELLKRYCDRYYNYCRRQYIEPRLELRELTKEDDNIPAENIYQLIVDGNEEQVIAGIRHIKKNLEDNKNDLLKVGDLMAVNFSVHMFQPLFHVRRGGKITVLPVALNESEYQFVSDLKKWCDTNSTKLETDGTELFLLRNMSRGKGVGFFEAGNFHPDFIFWVLTGGKQYVTFIEPHGLLQEGPGSEKVKFHKRIKDVQKRLHDSDIILNSFILSWTKFPQLKWDSTQEELENKNILFMTDDRGGYIEKLFAKLRLK